MSAEEPRNTELWAQASERLRDLTKWIVATFGAIGVALTAGVQFTQIRDLQDGSRVGLSFLGLAVALLGTLVAISSSVHVMSAGTVSLDELEAVDFQLEGTPEGKRSLNVLRPPYGMQRTWLTVRVNTERYFTSYRENEHKSLVADLKERLGHRYRDYIGLRMDLIAMEDAVSDGQAGRFLGHAMHWSSTSDRAELVERIRTASLPASDPVQTKGATRSSLRSRGQCLRKRDPAPEPSVTQPDPSSLVSYGEKVQRNVAGEYLRVEDMANLVTKFASAELVRLEFRRSLKFLMLGALLTAVGIGIFVWAAYTPSAAGPPS